MLQAAGLAAQVDTADTNIFAKITSEVQAYKIDTTSAPDDKKTRKILELRRLRGGFNINEAIAFKQGEDDSKKEIPEATRTLLKNEFANGAARRQLDNAVVWIYRQHFSYKELKQFVRFYRKPAAQKLATDFPVIMLKSLMAAEMIRESVLKK